MKDRHYELAKHPPAKSLDVGGEERAEGGVERSSSPLDSPLSIRGKALCAGMLRKLSMTGRCSRVSQARSDPETRQTGYFLGS